MAGYSRFSRVIVSFVLAVGLLAGCSSGANSGAVEGLSDFPIPDGVISNVVRPEGEAHWTFMIVVPDFQAQEKVISDLANSGFVEESRVVADRATRLAFSKGNRLVSVALETVEEEYRVIYNIIDIQQSGSESIDTGTQSPQNPVRNLDIQIWSFSAGLLAIGLGFILLGFRLNRKRKQKLALK